MIATLFHAAGHTFATFAGGATALLAAAHLMALLGYVTVYAGFVDELSDLYGASDRAARDLSAANDRLQSEVAQRRAAEAELTAYAARLAASNRVLEEFASVASHDLREPLRKVALFGERLEQRAGARLDEESLEYLKRMRGASARMQRLIDDLLALSQLSEPIRPLAPVALDGVLANVLDDLEARIEATGAEVNVQPLPTVMGDPSQLAQLFQNLIGNSLKFQRPDAQPRIRVDAAPGAHGWTEIAVEDNGVGFQPQLAALIFQPFQRLHSRDDFEGSGLGLAICERIVDRHGGTIRAASDERGSRFVVRLREAQPVTA
jgi:signal transduction histidine kinase